MGLLASRFQGESFPLVIIDALFCGKPVIASDIGEIKNMLTDEQGNVAGTVFALNEWEIPIDRLADIVALYATERHIYDKALKTVTNISPRFDIKNVASLYIHQYKKMMGEL